MEEEEVEVVVGGYLTNIRADSLRLLKSELVLWGAEASR